MNNLNPPKKALQFLRWFCREDYLEEIEGDLTELYEIQVQESPGKAKRIFIWSVLRYLRPGFIKSFKKRNYSISPAMLKSDLKISWRNLKKQPFFTFLNTFGLAIGISGAMLISLFIYDELSFDKMYADADRIYRVHINNRTAGEVNNYASVSGPLAEVIMRDYPQVESVTRMRNYQSILLRELSSDQNVKENSVAAADSAFFRFFGIDLLAGGENEALIHPFSIVLTKTAAEKHFPLEDALGKTLVIDNDDMYTVTGVIDDFPQNSIFRDLSVLISISSFEDSRSDAWNNWNFPTFVKLLPNADEGAFYSYLDTVKDRYLIPWAMTFIPGLTVESARAQQEATGDYMIFGGLPFTDVHLHSPNMEGEFNQNSDIQNVYILSLIGLFLILLACVNFMNLSTAHAMKRAKEVGVRKTLGSNRFALIRQFLTESGLTTLLSFIFAVSITTLAIPYFNHLAGKTIAIPFQEINFWLVIVISILVMGLFSGSYPAFVLSRFIPIKVLKGNGQESVGGSKVRNSLVVVQFSISILLMISTLVVFQQVDYIQNKDLGYQKEQILVLDDVYAVGNELPAFKEQVQSLSQISEVSLSSFLPTPSARNGVTFFQKGRVLDPESALIIGNWRVDYDYISTLNLEIVAGRDFNEQYGKDSSSIIINESVVEMLGVTAEEAIGLEFTNDFRRDDKENMKYLTIIGVVKNFHFETMRSPIDALSLVLGSDPNKMMVKLDAGNFSESIAQIEKVWNNVAPGQPFQYYFLDDAFNDVYQAELRLSKIFMTFSLLSILIACLGLFGLAAYNAERRIKEIGIRKVMGASVTQITFRLSTEFLKLVGISILIALPIGWYSMNQWLLNFSYRIDIGWEVFASAAFLAITVSILTVSYQSIKAAIANPINSLKNE